MILMVLVVYGIFSAFVDYLTDGRMTIPYDLDFTNKEKTHE